MPRKEILTMLGSTLLILMLLRILGGCAEMHDARALYDMAHRGDHHGL